MFSEILKCFLHTSNSMAFSGTHPDLQWCERTGLLLSIKST